MADPLSGLDVGRLSNNFMFVNGLRSALSKTETNVSAVVKSVKVVIGQDCWRHWITPENNEVQWSPADFREFIQAPWPAGCGTPLHILERVLRGTDAWEPYQKLERGGRGAPEGNQNASGLRTGSLNLDECKSNRDTIPDCYAPTDETRSTIPLSPDAPRPRNRDYQREAPTGTSVSYSLRRLSTQRPDLYEKVKAGESSAHGAMVEAGFTPPKITIPRDPKGAARLILKHFQGETLAVLIRDLANHAGIEIVESTADSNPDPS